MKVTITRHYSIDIEVPSRDGGTQIIVASFSRHGTLKSTGYGGSPPSFDSCYGALIEAGVELGMKIKADLDACEGVKP